MSSFDTATSGARLRLATTFDSSSVTGASDRDDQALAGYSATPLDILRSLRSDVVTLGTVILFAASVPTSAVIYSFADPSPTAVTRGYSRRRRRISLGEARALAIEGLRRAERIRDVAAQEEWRRSSYFAELT